MDSKPQKAYKDYLKGNGELEYALLPFDNEDNAILEKIKKKSQRITPDKKNKN